MTRQNCFKTTPLCLASMGQDFNSGFQIRDSDESIFYSKVLFPIFSSSLRGPLGNIFPSPNVPTLSLPILNNFFSIIVYARHNEPTVTAVGFVAIKFRVFVLNEKPKIIVKVKTTILILVFVVFAGACRTKCRFNGQLTGTTRQ